MQQFDANVFSFRERCFIAEASTLGFKPGQEPGDRVYKDAADVGIALRSPITGKLAVFALHQTRRDRDSDVVMWVFEPIRRHHELLCNPSEVAPFESYGNTTVVILND